MKVDCDYCGEPAELIDSVEIYGTSYGMVWQCKPCGAYVGCHKNSKKHAPLGRLANAELRYWKKRAHAAFDPVWQSWGAVNGLKPWENRAKGYSWLALKMQIPKSACHIGMFDIDLCKQAIEACNEKAS